MRKRRGNGQGTVYKRGNTYRAQLTRYEMGERITKTKGGFRTKKEAYEWCAKNASFDGKTCPTFGQVAEEWKAIHYPNLSDKKRQQYDHVLAVSQPCSGQPFDSIGIRQYNSLLKNQKPTNAVYRLFKSVWSMMSEYAIRAGYMETNHAELIELPPATKPNKRAFTAEEVRKVWEYWEKTVDMAAGACLIMLYTGMRYGEISTILPENVHLEEGYLTGGIKTEAGKAGDILIIDRIKPIVGKLLLPENQVAGISAEGFRKKYNRMQEAAGIERHTVHECRHTTATLLAEAGVQAAVITAIMRHTNYAQTLEYTHISRKKKLEELDRI